MAYKSLVSLALLLVLQAAGHLQPAAADAGQVPAAAVGKPASAARAGESEKGGANWERDLFAIFREGPELDKNAASAVAPELQKIAAIPATPKKYAVPRELKLQGIVFSSEAQALALVDGKIVRQGEMVDGWLVRRITRHGLLLEDPVGRREYELLAGSERAMVRSRAIITPE